MTFKGLFSIHTLNLTWIFDLELSWVQYRKYVFVLKRVPAKIHWFHLNVEFFPPSCWFLFAKEEFGAVWEQLVCDPTIGCLLLIGGCYGAGRSHWVLRWCWGTSAGQWTETFPSSLSQTHVYRGIGKNGMDTGVFSEPEFKLSGCWVSDIGLINLFGHLILF